MNFFWVKSFQLQAEEEDKREGGANLYDSHPLTFDGGANQQPGPASYCMRRPIPKGDREYFSTSSRESTLWAPNKPNLYFAGLVKDLVTMGSLEMSSKELLHFL